MFAIGSNRSCSLKSASTDDSAIAFSTAAGAGASMPGNENGVDGRGEAADWRSCYSLFWAVAIMMQGGDSSLTR